MAKASVYFELTDIDGKRGEAELKQQLDRLPGVISVSVNQNKNRVAVDFDTTGTSQTQIHKQLDNMGYSISSEQFEEHVM
jgi:copper chaperone CopZ